MVNGCTEYETTHATIYFPKDHICCDLCPVLQTYSRKQCNLTGEYILDSRGTGMWCPLTKEDENGIPITDTERD